MTTQTVPLEADCPACGCPLADHPLDEYGVRSCTVSIDDLPTCRSCRERVEALLATQIRHQTHEQALMCLGCGIAGVVPPDRFPQLPGPSIRSCPICARHAVWIAEPSRLDDARVHPARVVEDYLAEQMKRGNRRARGASQ